MEKLALSLYTGSLFLIVFVVAPSLLRTDKDKNLAGHFYGKILWRFYKIAFFLLLVYLILGNKWLGLLLLLGFSLNMAISMKLRRFKRSLGDIEKYGFYSPQRVRFRKLSYLSTAVLLVNFLIATIILLEEVG